MEELHDLFRKHYELLSGVFTFYSCTGTGARDGSLSIGFNDWRQMLNDCK